MTTAETSTVRPPAEPAVRWLASEMTIRDASIFGPGGDALALAFLCRVLALAEVRSVVLDRNAGAATLVHDDSSPEQFSSRVAAALRGAIAPLAPGNVPRLAADDGRGTPWSVHRHGAMLTRFEVVCDTPGRLRLRRPVARADRVRIETAVARLAGVDDARWSRWTDSLVITYDPALVDVPTLLRGAEAAVAASRLPASVPAPVPVRFGMANATLGVAAAGEVLTALTPVSAVLIVGTSVKTVEEAVGDLRQGRLGLPMLYSTIAVVTLTTGQYLTGAIMGWMFRYWKGRTQDDLHRGRLQLAGELQPSLPTACLVAENGAEVRVAVARLRPGDRVVVAAGEVVPADGPVISGGGLVDERGLAWGGGVLSRLPGDRVQAGSTLLTGLVRVAVERAGKATRAAAVGRAIEVVTRPNTSTGTGTAHLTPRAARFAGRTVGPSLATAGVGLLVGGAGTAIAILRPDYASGPSVADTLEALHDVAVGLHHGVLVRDPSALMRLPSADLIVVDDHPSLRRHGLDLAMVQTPLPESESVLRYAAAAARHLGDDRAEALADACRARSITMLRLDAESVSESVVVRHRRRHVRLFGLPPNADAAAPLGLEIDGQFVATLRFRRSRRPAAAGAMARLRARTSAPFVLLSDHPARETAALAAALGIEQHLGGLSVDDRARFLHDCQARGLRPAWVGAAGAAARLAPACHVAIAHADADADDLDTSPAAVLLLAPGLGPLADLWDIAGGHAERLRSAERSVLVPNLLCVAGAFTLGLSSLATVCVSNLGTYGVYSRSAATLRALRHAGRPRANPTARVHFVSPVAGVPRVAAPA